MANPAIGEVPCPIGDEAGHPHTAALVRETKGRKALYIRCDSCGTLQPRLSEGQEYMRQFVAKRGRVFDPDDPDAQAAREEVAEENRDEQAQAANGLKHLRKLFTAEDEPHE
jgi:hypothetical protein